MNIGVVGCGNISGIYFNNLSTVFANTNIYACCDLCEEKAKAAAEKYNIPRIMTLDEMLADPGIDTILNITTPQTHYSICKKALLAGKNVYVEKPLSLEYAQGKELVELAEEKGLYLGSAPDTFMGAGIQTSIELIKSGAIGRPIGGAAHMLCPGHEGWHPSPEFYYDFGGGPMFDMGPYYITALVRMLGRVKSVFARNIKAFDERTIKSQPKCGQKMPVKVDTHDTGILCFENGAVVTVVMSFDVIKSNLCPIEIYGTEGSLSAPDPNTFGGPLFLATRDDPTYKEIPLPSDNCGNLRGIGLAETDVAINEQRINNASGMLALHVLEIMEAFMKSSECCKMIEIESSPSPDIPFELDLEKGDIKTKI